MIGDITPMDGISKAEKSQREQAALEYMCKIIGEGSRGAYLSPCLSMSLLMREFRKLTSLGFN